MSHRQYHISTVYIQTDTVSIRFGKHEHLLDKVRIPGQWRIRELFCIFGLWGMKKYWKILLPKRIWTIIVAVVIIYDSSLNYLTPQPIYSNQKGSKLEFFILNIYFYTFLTNIYYYFSLDLYIVFIIEQFAFNIGCWILGSLSRAAEWPYRH